MNSNISGPRLPQAHVWLLVESWPQDDSIIGRRLLPDLNDEELAGYLGMSSVPTDEEIVPDASVLEALAADQKFAVGAAGSTYCLVRLQRIHGRTPEESQYLQELMDRQPKTVWVLEEVSMPDYSLSRRWKFSGLSDREAAEILGLEALGPGEMEVPSASLRSLATRYGIAVDEARYLYLIGKEQAPSSVNHLAQG